MKSAQLRVFVVDNREMHFNLDLFQRLFMNKVGTKGISIGSYEDELARVLFVERATIHNWRMNMNGPSDLEKIRMLEEYWNLGVNGLLVEVKGMQTEKRTMNDRELDALKRVYVAFMHYLFQYKQSFGFQVYDDGSKYDCLDAQTCHVSLVNVLETEYIDLPKDLYTDILRFFNGALTETLNGVGVAYDEEDRASGLMQSDSVVAADFYMESFRNIVDDYR